MKKENIAIVLAVFAFIFGFIGMVGDKSTAPVSVGGTTNYDDLGLSTLTVTGASTLGTVNIATSNAATSTIKVGCVQMYATSTATAIHLEFSTTTALASYSGGTAPTGGVSWRYGACPV